MKTLLALLALLFCAHAFAAVSPNGTCIGAAPCTAISLTDASGNTWTVASGVVSENGKAAGFTAGVTELEYANGVIWQFNGKLWWSWTGTNWTPVNGQAAGPVASSSSSSGGASISGGSSGGATSYQAVVTWTAPPLDANGNATTITGFNVYEGATPSTLAKVASVGPTVTTYTIQNLPAGQVYVGVTALDAQGESQLVSPLAAVPESVLNLSVVIGTVVP